MTYMQKMQKEVKRANRQHWADITLSVAIAITPTMLVLLGLLE